MADPEISNALIKFHSSCVMMQMCITNYNCCFTHATWHGHIHNIYSQSQSNTADFSVFTYKCIFVGAFCLTWKYLRWSIVIRVFFFFVHVNAMLNGNIWISSYIVVLALLCLSGASDKWRKKLPTPIFHRHSCRSKKTIFVCFLQGQRKYK